MKILILGNQDRYDKFLPDMDIVRESEIVFADKYVSEADALSLADDAQVIFADAIAPVTGSLMRQMPNLRMVHSEGVAYDKIDLETASELGIYVCNNKGANAGAVAEQTVLLMLACLRSAVTGDAAVRGGRQIQMKEERMVQGITDLADCKVGIIGLGDIGKAVAARLTAFGCELYYYSLHQKNAETEAAYHVTYLPLEELLAVCDLVSLNCAVTPETTNLADDAFFARMKKDAYLINTGRGELVDNEALCRALTTGEIAGAGLDTVAPEPVQADHPLLLLPQEIQDRIVFSPHLGGITTGSFRRMHRHMWENAERISRGEKPFPVVNAI